MKQQKLEKTDPRWALASDIIHKVNGIVADALASGVYQKEHMIHSALMHVCAFYAVSLVKLSKEEFLEQCEIEYDGVGDKSMTQ
jgi:hypothetical protein